MRRLRRFPPFADLFTFTVSGTEEGAVLRAAASVREELRRRGVPICGSAAPIIPIRTQSVENTLLKAKQLYERGVYVNPVLPPAVAPGGCLLRTSYMATHTEELLDEAMDIIAEVFHDE